MAALIPFLIVLTSLPLWAAPQQSLGDVARQLRQQQLKAGSKTTRVYTNDDLSGQKAEGGFVAAPVPPSAPVTTAPSQTSAETESPQAAKPASQAPGSTEAATPSKKTGDRPEEYWQERFKSLRAQLAEAEERQQLVEDEVNLLQIQAARALNSDAKTVLAGQITSKQEELSQKQAITSEARKSLEDLQSEFEASGAPEAWSEDFTLFPPGAAPQSHP